MSSQTRSGQHNRKNRTVDSLAERIASRIGGPQGDAAASFARICFRHASPEDIAQRNPEDLYGTVVSLWKWIGRRRRPGAAVRVYNPSLDRHGWRSTHTVIEILNDDMPFLVDSVLMEMNRRKLSVHWLVHPVVRVTRGPDNGLLSIAEDADADADDSAEARPESVIHLEVDEQTAPETLRDIAASLETVLQDVRAAWEDWAAMRDQAGRLRRQMENAPPESADARDIQEAAAFLDWMHAGNFTFLGYRSVDYQNSGGEMRFAAEPGSGLGILRDGGRKALDRDGDGGDGAALPARIRKKLLQPVPLRLYKSDSRSTVHRGVHMDVVAVTRFDEAGVPVGEHLFLGLLTSSAYTQSARDIPLLRSKVETVMSRTVQKRGGHFASELLHVLNSYPRDELFQIDADLLQETALGIARIQRRRQVGVFIRPYFFERHASVLVFITRDRFSTALREKLGDILSEGLEGQVIAQNSSMTDDLLSRFHFILRTPGGRPSENRVASLTARISEACRSWEDRLRQALLETHGEEQGMGLFHRYENAFPVAYRENLDVRNALQDIQRLEELRETGSLTVALSRPLEAGEHEIHLNIYNLAGGMILSEVVPILENMGVRTLEMTPYEIRPLDGPRVDIHEFSLETADRRPVDILQVQDAFQEGFRRIWRGVTENDALNRLILAAGLGWRDIMVIRAYEKYLRQTGIPFSDAYMAETLVRNAGCAADLVTLFKRRFDPDLPADGGAAEEEISRRFLNSLDTVANLDEDRILRRFLNIVQATLRTSCYQTGEDGAPRPWLALKLDSRAIADLPRPAPFCEIFVYSPRFEAVHLRFGKVARGGIRWSDRREDFRTEVLGLVKAQQVKNAVIVPTGAKGGFVLKKAPPPSRREEWLREGVACYRNFIQAMLDITDNLDSAGKVCPPDRVVRRDGDDPYLVVAADKGTASFSDYANEISLEHGFWLGDAFASGGSSGYDHKKMGITARGGWESVKRHFREMGRDIQASPFTVIGVGDMGGDVFGNAMLLSPHIRLVAAFNHSHVFLDPDPDTERSFAERQRLFACGGNWDAYDKDLLSAGGGVFSRDAKAVALSPEIRALLGVSSQKLTPAALIQAILQAPADLLWFGGIGTYVKEEGESHADAGDRANDALRINAGQLRCKVIGEGANLGMTQRARIAFARAGGRINTDAIDNSAGVDCSDHEVNIKILLNDVVRGGDMTGKQRDTLLKKMTDEVAGLVLRNNYQQTQSISVVEAYAAKLLDRHQRMMRSMEKAGLLDRALEALPDDEEIAARMKAQQGLTRPELATLLAYAKNFTYQALLESGMPDDPLLTQDLMRYFPEPLRRDFAENLQRHPLRREIITTVVINSMLNRTDPGFVTEMSLRTGRDVADVIRAYTIVREVFDLRALWLAIEGLDNSAPAAAQIRMFDETKRTVMRMTEWFLRNAETPLDITANIETYRPGVEILQDNLADILGSLVRDRLEARVARFRADGVPDALAVRIGRLKVLSGACDVVRLAVATGAPVAEAGAAYTATGERLGMDWLRTVANAVQAESPWQRMALAALVDDLWSLQSALTGQVIRQGKGAGGAGLLADWAERNAAPLERVDALLQELRGAAQPDLAMLSVALRELRLLLAE